MDRVYIERVLEGDTEAFRYFIRTYTDMAFKGALAIVKDELYAEEIVQDAFLKAFKGLKSYNYTGKFKSWFYKIVVNESFQHLRRMKKYPVFSSFSETNDFLNNRSLKEHEKEKDERIFSALRSLPSNEGLAINLFYLEEYSLKDICEITGWSMSKTKVLLHRGRKELRVLLAYLITPTDTRNERQ